MVEYQDEARLTKIHEVAIWQCSTRAQRSDICDTGRARPIEATVEGVAQAKGASVQEEGVEPYIAWGRLDAFMEPATNYDSNPKARDGESG